MEQHQTLKLILRTDELPTLPTVVHQILGVTGDPSSSTRQLTELIERDPSLSANLLKLVNSAYFGFSRTISQVHDAAVLVGYSTIRTLALSTSVISAFDTGQGLDARAFWEHSISTAIAAGTVARTLGHEQNDLAFMAGLLHDIGVLIFALRFPDAPEGLYDGDLHDLLTREEAVFGMNHAVAGGFVARHWKFEPELTRAIEEHHLPSGAAPESVGSLARLVRLAEWLASDRYPLDGPGVGTDDDMSAVADSLGYDMDALVGLGPVLEREYRTVDALMAVDTQGP
ncbi:MAG: HDOD domain-containing protein [Leptospirillia bacterium]